MENWKNTKCEKCAVQRKSKICNSCIGYCYFNPMSNADRIRSMSDEELAGLTITYNDYYGEYYCSDEERYDSYEDAIKHEIEWLQSEAE